jgi:hypothetical protein
MKPMATLILRLACLTGDLAAAAVLIRDGAGSPAIAQDKKLGKPAAAARIDFRDVAKVFGLKPV